MATHHHLQDDAREKLLDAAEHMFGEADFASVSIRAIAKAADVNPALIKYHFGHKEGLCEATLTRKLGRLLNTARAASAEASDKDRLVAVFKAISECAHAHKEGPFLELNYRTFFQRRGKRARDKFRTVNMDPINKVLTDAAQNFELDPKWQFLTPNNIVMFLLALPIFWKLFGDVFLPTKELEGKSARDLHQEGGRLGLEWLKRIQKEVC